MKSSYWLLHLSVLCLGFSGVFGKLISLNEGLLTWYRVVFSAIILFIILLFSSVKRPQSLREKFTIGKNGLFITLSWLLFYASIKCSTISIGVVCYCMASFFTAILEPIINKKKFRWNELLLSTITIVGISLIFHFDTSYHLGIILGIISPFFASLYTIYNERLVKNYDVRIINYYQMVVGAIGLGLCLPFCVDDFSIMTILPSWKNIFYLLFLSVFCTVGVYIVLTEILKKISAFTVNLSLNLEPIYAIVIAYFFFDEGNTFSIYFFMGLSLVILSVCLQTIFSLKKKKHFI